MNWQLWVVVAVIAGAVVYLARLAWKTWAGKPGCGNGCGGCAKPSAESASSTRRLALPQIRSMDQHG